jgi:hypothetical protein
MKRFAVAALVALAACASSAPTSGAPTSAEISAAVLADLEAGAAAERAEGATVVNEVLAVDALSCRPVEDGCFQCRYTVDTRHTGQAPGEARLVLESSEPRIDMVCNATGSWTLTPMSQIGS